MLFKVQPESCRMQVVSDVELPTDTERERAYKRLIEFDPTDLYKGLGDIIDPFKRRVFLTTHHCFPDKKDGRCGCGCGKPLYGRRKRWASEECSLFAYYVQSVIQGDRNVVNSALRFLNGGKRFCASCNSTEEDVSERMKNAEEALVFKNTYDLWRDEFDVDHIIPVHAGGGGCWLSNYQHLCIWCHREKSGREKKMGGKRGKC